MKKPSKKSQSLPVIHPHAAGIDIGASFHVVAIAPDKTDEPVRTFKAFTSDLHEMANGW
jgi:transposase